MPFETFDTVANRRIAYFDAPDLDVAIRIARNTARLMPDNFPNGAAALFTCKISIDAVAPEHRAALERFGEVVLPIARATTVEAV